MNRPSPRISAAQTTPREVYFRDNAEKARFMWNESMRGVRSPLLQWWAQSFRALPSPARASAILRFVQYAIDYVRDPGTEVLDDVETILERGYADCDGKQAILNALCLACGIPAVTLPVIRGESFPHVRNRILTPQGWQVADGTIENSTIGHLPPPGRAVTNHW